MSRVPSSIKSKLNSVCTNKAKAISKLAPEMTEKQLAKWLSETVCKDVDDKLLMLLAEGLLKQATKGAKNPPNIPFNLNGTPNMKKPGSNAVSFTFPFPELDFGKFELEVWADPKDFEKGDKGVMLNFTVIRK